MYILTYNPYFIGKDKVFPIQAVEALRVVRG
jgi:hypothetical protein